MSADASLRHARAGRDGRSAHRIAPALSGRAIAPKRPPAFGVIRIGLLGYGRVGQAVASLAARERARLARRGVAIRCVSALVRDPSRPRGGPAVALTSAPGDPLAGVDVVVEVLGGLEPARTLVARALAAGLPVVTANKTLMAYHGPALRALAARHGTRLAYDAAVLAGVPCLGALAERPLVSAARRITGIINGTSHFIASALAGGARFDRALADAVARGYAEPDSEADTSGRDAAEKLAILLHLAGARRARADRLPRMGLDRLRPGDFACARRLGGTIKPVADASLTAGRAGAWVGPAFVPEAHPFARLTGVTNALRLTPRAGHDIVFIGPGAGPEATALTILDDVVETARAGGRRGETGDAADAGVRAAFDTPPASGWLVLAETGAEPGGAGPAASLGAAGLTVARAAQNGGTWTALVAPAPWAAAEAAGAALRGRSTRVLILPALDAGAEG